MRKKILINIFSNNAGKAFEMILGFLIVPFLIHKLSGTSYGIIILLEALMVFFELSVGGVGVAIGRYVGLNLAKNESAQVNAYLATGKTILYVFLSALSGVFALILIYFNRFFNVPVELRWDTMLTFILMVVGFLIQILATPSWAIVYARQRFDLLNLYASVRNVARVAALYSVYSLLPPQLYYYGIVYLGTVSLEKILIYVGARQLFRDYAAALELTTLKKFKEMIGYVFSVTLTTINSLLYDTTDIWLINRLYGPYANSIYAIALKSVGVLRRLLQQSVWVLTPTFTELYSKNEKAQMEQLFTMSLKAATLCTIPLCIAISVFAQEFVLFWVGKEYLPAVPIIYLQLISTASVLSFSPCSCVINAVGKLKVPSQFGFVMAVLNVIASLVFALQLKMGLSGFAAGTLMSQFIFSNIFLPIYVSKITGWHFQTFYWKSFLKPFFLTACLLGSGLFYAKQLVFQNLWLGGGLILVLIIFYLFIAYVFLLDTFEKKQSQILYKKLLNKLQNGKRSFLTTVEAGQI